MDTRAQQKKRASDRYEAKHREKRVLANRERYQNIYRHDPEYMAKQVAKALDYRARRPLARLANSMRSRLRQSIVKSRGNTFELVGCQLNELRQHLEAQFTEGMTWANYGSWHVDHRIPLASATSPDDLACLCHYTNLQPLWAVDNLRKGSANGTQ